MDYFFWFNDLLGRILFWIGSPSEVGFRVLFPWSVVDGPGAPSEVCFSCLYLLMFDGLKDILRILAIFDKVSLIGVYDSLLNLPSSRFTNSIVF